MAAEAKTSCGLVSLLYGQRGLHVRMKSASVGKSSCLLCHKRPLATRRNRARVKTLVVGGRRVGNSVVVGPLDGVPHVDGERSRLKLEALNQHGMRCSSRRLCGGG